MVITKAFENSQYMGYYYLPIMVFFPRIYANKLSKALIRLNEQREKKYLVLHGLNMFNL